MGGLRRTFCKMLAPQFAAAATELEGKPLRRWMPIKIKSWFANKSHGTAHLLFLKTGQLVDRTTGVTLKTSILKQVKPLLSEGGSKGTEDGVQLRFWERERIK